MLFAQGIVIPANAGTRLRRPSVTGPRVRGDDDEQRVFATIGRLCGVVAVLLALASAPAHAGGGAHVVDDAGVEAPGTCHVEAWVARYSPAARLASVSPACTREAWPRLELGGFVQHLDPGGETELDFGPAVKYALRAPGRWPGVAVAAGVGWSTRTDRIETASAIVPLTLDLTGALRVNANAGWTWVATGDVHGGFVGAQVEAAMAATVSLMGEVFARAPGRVGTQAGVRWTPVPWLDLDLLGGSFVDGAARGAVTLGVTVRR